MQNATEDQRGLLQWWALAAIPAESANRSSSSSRSHNPCPAAGQPGHSSALLQHPGDTTGTQSPPSVGGEGRRGASQVLRLNPPSVQEMDFAGGFVSTLHFTNLEQRPWSESSRTGHRTEPLRARVQQDLSARADVQDAKLKFKAGEGVGRARNRNSMDGEQRQEAAQDSTHAHSSEPTSPHWRRRGAESAEEQLQPLLAAAYLRSHTWSRGKKTRSQMLNEITRASRSPSHEHQMWQFPPSTGAQASPGQG